MESEKDYEDISIFEGWRQFKDDTGNEWRAEIRGEGSYHLFKREGDAFSFVGAVRVTKKSVQEILNREILEKYRHGKVG